ncbi:MAG TPA: O-antigen ligase family protein, partial [Planctomycetes bacterium]|nr:O-antigen ligase family protein [Planctomycetota bacterium]
MTRGNVRSVVGGRMREPHQHQPVPGRAAMRALPLLLLFPAFLVAWPLFGAPLRDDPFPHLAGSAWVALASVPLALVLFRTTSRTKLHARGLGTLLALWVFVALRVFLRSGTDWFEAIRALTLVSTWPVLFLGGAQLDTHGRRALGRGLVWLSLLVTASALVRSRFTGDLSGVLGNTGPLSQLALPGAVIGAWYVATRRGRYFLIGALAVTSFLLHAGLAPVLAGGLVFTLVLVASSLLSPWAKGRAQVRRRLGMLAALSVFGFVVLQGPRSADSPEPAAESPVAALTRSGGNLGGVEVRLRIWRSIAPVLASRPLLGLGPGQFQARYPRYRDPREIEASRGGVCSTRNTEADHAHNDLLHGLAELGLVGGAIWLAFLLLSLRASLSALSQTDFPTIGLGAGALAILFASLFHSPLWFNPPASAVALVLFGSVLGRSRSATRAPMRPGIALTCLTVLLIGLFRGHLLIGHGRALAAYVESVRSAASGDPAADPATLAATSLTRYPASAPL